MYDIRFRRRLLRPAGGHSGEATGCSLFCGTYKTMPVNEIARSENFGTKWIKKGFGDWRFFPKLPKICRLPPPAGENMAQQLDVIR